MNLDKEFWSSRYSAKNTGWDLGVVSPPIKDYIDQLEDKSLKILIPGAGNSYEAEYLFKKGFENIYVVDIADQPLSNLLKRVPGFPKKHLIELDFYDLVGTYDLILEQTFFCALPTSMRQQYAKKAYELLNVNGKIAGVLFNIQFQNEGPPFGGEKDEYLNYFSKLFNIETFEQCYNSILPRVGNELFFIFKKNKTI